MYSAFYPRVIPPNIGGLNHSVGSKRNSALGHRVTPLDTGGLDQIRGFRAEFRTYCARVRQPVRGYRRFVTTPLACELGLRVYGIPNSDIIETVAQLEFNNIFSTPCEFGAKFGYAV